MHNEEAAPPYRIACHSATQYLLTTIVMIFLIEALIMVLIYFVSSDAEWNEILVDSTLLIVLVSPVLIFLTDSLFHIEVSEYKQAEEELWQSEEKYPLLFETMTQGVVYQTADGKITSANSAAERILGLTLDQMQGRTSVDPRWKAIHDDGSDFPGEAHPSMLALKTGQAVHNVVMGVFNPMLDDYRWININATPLFRPMESIPYQVCTIFDDITETKLLETSLRKHVMEQKLMLKVSHEVSSTLDLENVLQNISDGTAELLDIDTAAMYLLENGNLFLGATTPPLDPQMPDALRWAPLSDHPHIEASILTRQPVVLPDTRMEKLTTEEAEVIKLRQLRSLIYLPFHLDETSIGVLILGTIKQAREFSEHELDLCRAISDQLSLSLQHARLHTELMKYTRELEVQITERKKAEEIVRVSQKLLQTTFDTIREAVFVLGSDREIITCNSAVERIFGYKPDELIGQHYSLIIPEMLFFDSKRPGRECQLFEKDFLEQEEFYLGRKNGETFPASFSAAIRRDDAGNFLGIVGTVRDITERRRAETERDKAHELLQATIDGVDESVMVIDTDYRVKLMNRVVRENYPCNDATAALYCYQVSHHRDAPCNGSEHPCPLAQVRETLQPVTVMHQHFQRDGKVRLVEIVASPLMREDGSLAGIIEATRDVTERKQIEEQVQKLKKAVENSHEVVFMTDPEGVITYINPEFTRLYGYSAEEVVGRVTPRILKSGLMAECDYEVFWQILLNKQTIEKEFVNKSKDGHSLDIVSSVNPILDKRGDIIGFLAIQRDITEQKRLEEEARQAEMLQLELAKEREIVALKDRFMSIVSHEFRTPLSVIQVSADLLERYLDKMTQERKQQSFLQIRQQITKLSNMIDEVLTIGRVQGGKIAFNPIPLDLESFCRKVVDEIKFADSARHHFEFSSDLPDELVQIDSNLVQPVLMNLLTNAVKYSPDESSISLELNHDKKNIYIKVIDEGIGIPEEDQIRLFEAFHRAGNVGTVNGTGLGLSIVKEYVELHGGCIEVDSTVEKGSTFRISLPKS